MDLIINSERCIGCGWCEEMAPCVFAVSEKMVATVGPALIPDEYHAVVQEAIRICPVRAIAIRQP